ncbi:putative poly(ADP-ribose) polymerase, catalytic domain, RST domain of plant [Rosa chinensis]|uniref:Putative poly(ADP-ribose) polymerase, catalytic domain, RST domain of plant n=1 Tax=Rosa chinensis TaxID=74649 RepID=A0A2P6QA16_ROSCH|nr:probable inactive poly [ADP-ribose] polymerase SRO2 [Rosa chinensis]PRQ31013.1 putative poly(ADP-ribose) polymerase, catalytic domain, RST domain of plant [Rosa chinensis]
MDQTQIVENEASGSNVDITEVEKHQDSVSGAGAAEADPKADKNANESGSGPSGSGSSDPDPFRVFTQDGTMLRVRGASADLIIVKRNFLSGMALAAGETTVVAVHKYPASNLTHRARFQAFRGFLAETVHKYGGIVQNAHLKTALYGGSRDEIAQILVHGFSAANANGGAHGCVQLVPAAHSLDAALFCEVDEAELRHVLVCRVIMGRVQFVPDGSNHVGPDFDTGCDSFTDARTLYVPAGSANSRICADFVISFRAPSCLWDYATYATQASGGFVGASSRGPRPQELPINLFAVLDRLASFVTPLQMTIAVELFWKYKGNNMGRHELIRQLRLMVGEEALVAAAKASASVNN